MIEKKTTFEEQIKELLEDRDVEEIASEEMARAVAAASRLLGDCSFLATRAARIMEALLNLSSKPTMESLRMGAVSVKQAKILSIEIGGGIAQMQVILDALIKSARLVSEAGH